VRNILRRTLALGLLTGLGFMAAAPAAFASTSIEAYGIQATGLVSLTKQPDATLGTPSPSNVASATVGLLLTTGVLHAAVSQGSGTETATATVASVGSPLITGLGLTTGVITTTCTANDGETTTGSVNIVNLVFGTNSLTGNIAPNTSFTVPGVASVVLNEQTPASPGTGDLVVNAIHITMLGEDTQSIIIGHAECGPAPSAEGAPLVSGAGLKLGLGLLACGGLTGALIWMRRLRTSQPA
jgi:hypothetical protein